jgi:tRNA threonylcarbamoyladenosine dehydratase
MKSLEVDLERRFGGLRRLYGDAAYTQLRSAHFAVVGLGGVGSWTAEALARCGVASLTLIDLDHVSESNINRQVQAVGQTLGQSKGIALSERIADIHPGCQVHVVDDFVTAHNWPALLPYAVDALVDACDQVQAKVALAHWALQTHTPFVTVGAAGGKRLGHAVELADLANSTHDPVLSVLRQRLRKLHGAPRSGPFNIQCVFSKEPVAPPQICDASDAITDSSLNCHGYGSSVMVTATFGLVAAGAAVQAILLKQA